mgnify:FL=1
MTFQTNELAQSARKLILTYISFIFDNIEYCFLLKQWKARLKSV